MTNLSSSLAKEKQSSGLNPHKADHDAPTEEYKQPLKSRILDIIMISAFFCGVTMMILCAPTFHANTSLSYSWTHKRSLHAASRLTPEQLHLSLGADFSRMYLTWATLDPVSEAEVVYCRVGTIGCLNDEQRVIATRDDTIVYENQPAWARLTGKRSRYLHTYRAEMKNLEPNALYIYRAVSKVDPETEFQSDIYEFVAQDLSNDNNRTYSIAMYGDLGLVNGQSIPRLISDVDRDEYDVIIHNGDFAYDLDTQNARYGDEFMRLIEPIAARVPYQVSVGNHELAQNFTHYDSRFSMINSGNLNKGERNNFYYSFNVGPIHFVAFSTEFYYYASAAGRWISLREQYEWLERDLAEASSPSERAKRPWIIVFGHRPMYCSSVDDLNCDKEDNILRKGMPKSGLYALEKLFYDNGVDVEFYSHEHQYERFLPIYNGEILPGQTDHQDPYLDPEAPVHIISGSAGCEERLDPLVRNPVKGSVKRISDYGYTRLKASCSSLRFEQISDDNDGSIVDQFTITKTRQSFPDTKAGQMFDCP